MFFDGSGLCVGPKRMEGGRLYWPAPASNENRVQLELLAVCAVNRWDLSGADPGAKEASQSGRLETRRITKDRMSTGYLPTCPR